MIVPLLKVCALSPIYLLYALLVVSMEFSHFVYLTIVQNAILPVTDALWRIESRFVRIGCRFILAPHSFLVFCVLKNRKDDEILAMHWHRVAVESAVRANEGLLSSREGYCLSDLMTFVKAQFLLFCSGVNLKFTDGKKLQVHNLYRMLASRYLRPLLDNGDEPSWGRQNRRKTSSSGCLGI